MKTRTSIAIIKVILVTLLAAQDKAPRNIAGEHDHSDHAGEAHAGTETIEGPNKGRIITTTEPHVEFFITSDRKILLTFLDSENKAIALEDPTVSAIGGERAAPTRMTFVSNGEDGSLISDVPLPEGKNIPLILQIKTAPDAKNVVEKFGVDLSECPTCVHLEYACTCDHG